MRPQLSRRAWLRPGGALGLYVALATAVLARGVLASPSGKTIGDRGADKTIFMWSLVWWPHALGKARDPFVSHAVWAPNGIDLSWVTAIPGPSVLAFPVTWAAGPVATYTVLAVLAPALAAWSAFLLADWLTERFWPAVLAGYLFGFSAYEIGQTSGHLNLTLIFLVPLCALLAARRFAGQLSRKRFVALLALALALQLLTSAEVFTTLVLVSIIFGLVALWRLPASRRARLAATARESGLALLVCGVVVSPYLVHAFIVTGPSYAPQRSPFHQSADLLNFLVPTRFTWARPPGSASVVADFTSNPVESGAYLGGPLLAILVLAGLRRTRTRAESVLLLVLIAVAICSLGSRVRIDGHTVAPGPWEVAAKLPVSRAILPVRLSLFVALLAAIVCASWLAKGGRWHWALALTAAIAVFPNPSRSLWTADVPNPAFFRSGDDGLLTPSDTALVFPFGKAGWSMLWQADDHMRYRMIGGYLGNRPPSEARWNAFYDALITGRLPADAGRTLRRFLEDHHATVVVVAPRTKPSLRRLVRTLPTRPERSADAVVYRLKE